MFFFVSLSLVDPEEAAIEDLIGESILIKRQYHCYQTHVGQIAHYYALTADTLYDLCIAEDQHYSRIFAHYDRSILERNDYFHESDKPLLNRIFNRAI
ncbi:hypothetical protein [Paenibacillus monticola]|uniref:Uncharacterized protein n=1 Tax=Paenibacillus monticola TaxID=2666075 RepID=A0A7X2L150_9BACL|nr:hypothetical protein [Paenibacillus monticola]MRN51966.1 hypothetical protein [Paenibacillus monticola]